MCSQNFAQSPCLHFSRTVNVRYLSRDRVTGTAVFVRGHSKASKSYPFSSTRLTGGCPSGRRLCPFSSTAVIHACIPKQRCRASSYAATESYLVRLNDARRKLALCLFMHCVFGVLTSPLHIPVWAPTRSLLCRMTDWHLTNWIFCQQLTANACQSCHPHSPTPTSVYS